MRSRRLILCTPVALFCCLAGALCADQYYGPEYFAPTERVVSPHIAWATPYAKGPVKALFITYRQGMREVVEFAERLEMDYEVFAFHKPALFADPKPTIHVRGASVDESEKRLAEKLEGDCDVIVFGNVKWDLLPTAARATILAKVKAGAGLVGVILRDEAPYLTKALGEKQSVDAHDVVGAFPFESLPAFGAYDSLDALLTATVDFHRFGDGRIALMKGFSIPGRQILTPRPAGPALEMRLVNYDYYLAYPIHLMLWAARKPPDVAIRGEAVRMSRKAMTPVRFVLSCDGERDVDLRFVVRDEEGDVLTHEAKRAAVGRETPIAFDPGTLPAGRYFADLWVTRDGKTVNFGSVAVQVDGDTRIKSIAFAKESFSRTEPVAGTVGILNPQAGQSLRIGQVDAFGRLVREVTVNADHETVAFEAPPHDVLSIVQRLDVALIQGDDVIDVARRRFLIHDLYPEDGETLSVIFEPLYSVTFLNAFLCDEIARMGFDANTYASYYDRKRNVLAETLARANLYTIPDVYDYNEPHRVQLAHGRPAIAGEHGPMRDWCLSDPDYDRRARDLYQGEAERLKKYSTIDFNLNDECAFMHREAEACWSPACIKGFHAFLEKEYGTLDRVNAEYGTRYASWDEIIAPTIEATRKSPALRPIWVDHRRFMDSVYAGAFADARRWIDEVVPGAKVGYEGSGSRTSSFAAEDFWKLNQAMTLNGPYPSTWFFPFVRDFSPPGSVIGGGIVGAYPDLARCARNPAYLGYWPWRNLFEGANSFWVYEGTGGRYGGYYAVITPDFSPYPFFEPHIQAVKTIKAGVGRLLTGAQRADDGIAVLYSAASAHVGSLTKGFPSMGEVLKPLPWLIEDSGFQFRYVSYAQLAEGALDEGDDRLLILPWCQALSRKEIDEIKRFVESGGAVIADLRPGVTDQHGKPYDRSPLDALFGVRQNTTSPKPISGRITFKDKVGDFDRKLSATVSDASLELDGGKALAENTGVPAVVVNPVGKGTAVLLNFSLANYGEAEGAWVSKLLRAFFKNLLASKDITPEIRLKPRVHGLRAHRFVRGGVQYVGLLQDLPAFVSGANRSEIDRDALPSEEPNAVEVHLPSVAHVYDALKGEYLGCTDRLARDVVPGNPQLLALLPYEVTGIALDAPKEVRQGEKLRFEARLQASEDLSQAHHVLRVTLIDPDGTEVSCLGRNLDAPGGACQGAIEVALNERVGDWTIKVRDAATGVEEQALFKVTGERRASRARLVVPRESARTPAAPSAVVGASAAANVAPSAEYPVYRLSAPVTLDGRIEGDAGWAAIPWAAGFHKLGEKDFDTRKQTAFKMAHDDDALYIAVRCDEPDAAKMNPSTQDSGSLWKEDSLEVFVQPAVATAFQQYIVNPAGARWTFGKNVKTGASLPGTSLEAWQAAARTGEDTWSVEIAIPFAALGATPEEGASWRGNCCRNIAVFESGGDPHTTWAPLKQRFQEPGHFGTLRLEKGTLSANGAREIEAGVNAAYLAYLNAWVERLAPRIPALKAKLEQAAKQSKCRNEAGRLARRLQIVEEASAARPLTLDQLMHAHRQSAGLEKRINDLSVRASMDSLFD